MDAANLVVQIGLLLGTLGAAAVTWQQAIVAGRAEKEATAAQRKAEDAAARAISAAERSASAEERAASAAEEQVAIERAREDRRKPFEVDRQPGSAWRLRSQLDEIVLVIELDGSKDGVQYVQAHQDLPNYLKPGQALIFDFGGGMADPSSVNLSVNYRLASASESDVRTWDTTLT